MCKETGWTWDYVFNKVPWAIIERGIADQPFYDDEEGEDLTTGGKKDIKKMSDQEFINVLAGIQK